MMAASANAPLLKTAKAIVDKSKAVFFFIICHNLSLSITTSGKTITYNQCAQFPYCCQGFFRPGIYLPKHGEILC
jgi:hypothetical protein